MDLQLYLAYLLATIIVLVSPGPTVLLVVSYALSHGRRSAWATVSGVGLGDLTACSLSLAGMGAILAASAAAFTVLKWLGAAYLVYLGIRMWRQGAGLGNEAAKQRRGWTILGHAYAVTALNPKSIMFFVAFLPQFVSRSHSLWPQFLLLGGSFVILAVVNAAAYALLAGEVRRALARPGARRALGRLGGGVLIGAGLMTAALRRT